MSKQPTCTYCKRSRPLPYCHPNCRTPWTWKFTQEHRTTRPPLIGFGDNSDVNTELNDLRKIICLRKSEVSVEMIPVCNFIENLAEDSIYCLPCSYIIDVIDILP